MFRRPKEHMIESDAGFSVEQTKICTLVYREGDKKMTLTIEHLVGPDSFVVYLAEYSDCWDPPFDGVRVTDEHWRKIGENIREAYRSQGTQIRVFPLMSQADRDALRRGFPSVDD